MGVDYSASVAIGFYFTPDEVTEAFTEGVEEVSHLERRYDPRTGKEVGPEKVIDQEGGRRLVFKGEVIGDADANEDDPCAPQDLFEAIAGYLKCQYWEDGWYEDLNGIVFGYSPKKFIKTGWSNGPADTAGGIHQDDLLGLMPKMEPLMLKLRELGLKPGPAGVFPILSIT